MSQVQNHPALARDLVIAGRLPEAPQNADDALSSCSHLYLRGTLYYFRYTFPSRLQAQLGRTGIRLSLRTGHLRLAKRLAAVLYAEIQIILLSGTMLSYQEIHRRMNRLLQIITTRKLSQLGAQAGDGAQDAAIEARECRSQSEYYGFRETFGIALDLLLPEVFKPRKSDVGPDEHVSAIFSRWANDPAELRNFAEKCIPSLLEGGVFLPEEITPDNRLLITRAYLEMLSTESAMRLAHKRGDFSLEREFMSKDFGELPGRGGGKPAPAVDAEEVQLQMQIPGGALPVAIALIPEAARALAPTAAPPAPPARTSMLYSKAMAEFIKTKMSDGDWKENSLPDNKRRLESFITIIGDKPIADISREDMKNLRETLRRLPPNYVRAKEYKGKSIKAILASKPEKTLNVSTINTTVETVGGLLGWCVNEGLLTYNPGKDLQIKDKRQAIELHQAFTMADLKAIFAHPKFSQGKFKSPSYFWIPLIGLFTGMRLEEISQLHCADVYEVAGEPGLWVIDINELGEDETGHTKSLKTKNSRRLVPVHQELISLGLLVYLDKIKNQGHIRLFPDLKVPNRVKKLGKQPGKQFKDVVNDVLADAEGKSFHSLRHTFADYYKQRGWQTDMFRQLYGHSLPTLASSQYGSKFPPRLLYDEVIAKLDYGLDLNALKPPK